MSLPTIRDARAARMQSLVVFALAALFAADALAATGPLLSPREEKELRAAFRTSMAKLKGPYTQNFCVCRDGKKRPVQAPDGRITSPCGANARFCAAYRAPWAERLARSGMFIGNIFSRDLNHWGESGDPHDLVRGYILEKFFTETHPDHKLSQLRAYGGLSGAEYEARDAPRFFERYLAESSFDPNRHYLLAYELQKRFFVRDAQGQIQRARNLASAIYRARKDFKPLRDATHNQISAGLIPRLRAYRPALAAGKTRSRLDELIHEIEKLTSVDESALREPLEAISDRPLAVALEAALPSAEDDPLATIEALAATMTACREATSNARLSAPDRRHSIDLAITAAAVLQRRGNEILTATGGQTLGDLVRLLRALSEAAFGAGLLNPRERDSADALGRAIASRTQIPRRELSAAVRRFERVVEWAQSGVAFAFERVRPPWAMLLPESQGIVDDVLRGSPLLVYAEVHRRLQDFAAGGQRVQHEIFGQRISGGVRALNPGLATGTLRLAPRSGEYSRDDIVGLPETPPDLEPVAGIFTRGEGNVVSHVQLLARSLGIPNVVLDSRAFDGIRARDEKEVFLIATPGGRVIAGDLDSMSPDVKVAVDEFQRADERDDDGVLSAGPRKLRIDRSRIDIESNLPVPLESVGLSDSGARTGPKAAYLGELRRLFPENVARGVVIPFGAYYSHYRGAAVSVPKSLASRKLAQPGEALPDFVERTYTRFFDEMIASGTSERELTTWIRPRLEIIRHSIISAPLASELRERLTKELMRQGLLDPEDQRSTVGCFVRSDTNVEDLEDFNGAGLNLTLFNLRTLDDIFDGIRKVWASPFTYRSFTWRQTLIDEPLWVLPSIVVLESIASDKSGVLVTAGLEGGNRSQMLIATSEGVGGAVDGTPTETLVWSPNGVELVTMFKSPWRRVLHADGGSEVVPSTGRQELLSKNEITQLTDAASRIGVVFPDVPDASGAPRPWDIEFGFRGGQLWLFQARPFVGNDEVQNLGALRALDGPTNTSNDQVRFEEIVR